MCNELYTSDMEGKEMKIKLELNFCDAGVFLNYWDSLQGSQNTYAKRLAETIQYVV